MKYTEMKDLGAADLKKKKAAFTHDLFEAKMKNQIGQLGNPLEIRKIRKNIARLNTAIVQKIAR
jgi:large subunit ribosomal protein L29